MAQELTANLDLQAALLAQFGDYGQTPATESFFMHASVANHYIGGGWYPRGGATVIASSISTTSTPPPAPPAPAARTHARPAAPSSSGRYDPREADARAFGAGLSRWGGRGVSRWEGRGVKRGVSRGVKRGVQRGGWCEERLS